MPKVRIGMGCGLCTLVLFTILCSAFFGNEKAQAASENPNLQKGIEDFKAENYEEAIETLLKVYADNFSADTAYYLGLAYKETLNYSEAKRYLEKAVISDPSNVDAYLPLGQVLYGLKEYVEADKVLEKAADFNHRPDNVLLLRGLISLNSKDYKLAIDRLHAAASIEGESRQLSKYYLGIAYAESGRNKEAKDAFQEAVAMNEESTIAIYSRKGIEAIESRQKIKAFEMSIGYSFQYDDNVILKPRDDVSGVDISGEDDYGHIIDVKAEYSPFKSFRAAYYFSQSLYQDLTDFDTQSHQVALLPSLEMEKGWLYLLGSYEYFTVGDERYLQVFSVRPAYKYRIGEKKDITFFVGGADKRFFITPVYPEENRDGTNLYGGVSLFLFNNDNNRYRDFSLTYTFDKEDTDGVNWDYIGQKGVLTFQYPVARFLDINFAGQYYFQEYDNTHTTFGEKRKDKTISVLPELCFKIKDARIKFQYSYTRDKSNISIYDYERNVYSVGVEYTF